MKKEVFINLSKISIVIAPAKTGKDNNSKKTVTIKHKMNKFFLFKGLEFTLLLHLSQKFKDLKILETPARWSESIPRILPTPIIPKVARGGYKVQPLPRPLLKKFLKYKTVKEQNTNQKDNTLRRGNKRSSNF